METELPYLSRKPDWKSIVQVGAGRGFAIDGPNSTKLVLTAAHCLPTFPPCHGASQIEERTYKNLVGMIGDQPAIWVECLFIDPIADLAILGPPDDQALPEECDAYFGMLEDAIGPQLGDIDDETAPGWVFSLEREWRPCTIQHVGGRLWITNAPIDGGMSGSPILLENGSAIGLISVNHGPQPRLIQDLPGWCLRSILAKSP